MPRHYVRTLLLLPFLTGCSAGHNGDVRPVRNVIMPEEIRASGLADAFAVVQALRPGWLITRGQGSINQREEIKVYLDGLLMGGPEYLKQISSQSISHIRWYDGLDAANRWGLDHGLGVIYVSTRQAPK